MPNLKDKELNKELKNLEKQDLPDDKEVKEEFKALENLEDQFKKRFYKKKTKKK